MFGSIIYQGKKEISVRGRKPGRRSVRLLRLRGRSASGKEAERKTCKREDG